jgi:hypothetical protein
MHMGPNPNSVVEKVKGNPHWTREFMKRAKKVARFFTVLFRRPSFARSGEQIFSTRSDQCYSSFLSPRTAFIASVAKSRD